VVATGDRRNWGAQVDVEVNGPASFGAAVAPGGGRRFGSARSLERWPRTALEDLRGAPIRVVAAGGRLLLGWTGFKAGQYVARLADVAGGAVGAAQTLAVPRRDIEVTDLAAAPSGLAVVVAELGDPFDGLGRPRAIVAADRPAGAAAFAPFVIVSDGSRDAGSARVALDPTGRRAVALWLDGRRTSSLRAATLAP
jgi:hypothetical protein